MSVATVSFFSDLDVSSRTRRVSFPRAARPTLHMEIRQAVQSREFLYAYYTTSDGGTVVLDRQAVTVLVSGSFSPGNQVQTGPRSYGRRPYFIQPVAMKLNFRLPAYRFTGPVKAA